MRRPRTNGEWRFRREGPIDVGLVGDWVGEAMSQLSDPQRAMIYRSHYLGRTTMQIAAELGTHDDVVKRELHRALHALRMTLQSAGAGR